MEEKWSALQPPSPINNTWFRRILILASVALLNRYGRRRNTVLFLTKKLCVKYGRSVHLGEAAAMEYVASNSSIPVPKVHCAFERKGNTYIVMSRVPGEIIGQGWGKRSTESRERLFQQLRNYMSQLRALQPPVPGAVSGVGNSKLRDQRVVPGFYMDFGPFDTVEQFHLFLREGHRCHPNAPAEVNELVAQHERGQWTTHFVHTDLSSMNIMVEGDRVTGIIDWESAGWYPEYWEYTNARCTTLLNGFWREEIDNFLHLYPEELEMEYIRQKYFGALPHIT